jgi:hypothetical protein
MILVRSLTSARLSPEIFGTAACSEPGVLDNRCGIDEATRDARRVVCVATECDRLTAFLSPPTDEDWLQLSPRVHLQRPSACSKSPEDVAKLDLE